jgi:hypothetical protein
MSTQHPCTGLPTAARKAFDRIVRGRTPTSMEAITLLKELALIRDASRNGHGTSRYVVPTQLLDRWNEWHKNQKKQRTRTKKHDSQIDPRQMEFWPI